MITDEKSDLMKSAVLNPLPGVRRWLSSHGQAMVELALLLPVLLIVLLLGIQFAIIGLAALGLGQANYQGARYAAVQCTGSGSCSSAADVRTFMLNNSSPMISASSGRYLTSTVTPAPPCSFGTSVTVSVTFDTAHLVILPNPFFGVSFPTSLSSTESAFCEG